MKVLKAGLLMEHWRLINGDRGGATHCVHGRSLLESACADCTREINYEAEDDRPWRAAREGAQSGYCAHGVPLEEDCRDCSREMSEEGHEPA